MDGRDDERRLNVPLTNLENDLLRRELGWKDDGHRAKRGRGVDTDGYVLGRYVAAPIVQGSSGALAYLPSRHADARYLPLRLKTAWGRYYHYATGHPLHPYHGQQGRSTAMEHTYVQWPNMSTSFAHFLMAEDVISESTEFVYYSVTYISHQ